MGPNRSCLGQDDAARFLRRRRRRRTVTIADGADVAQGTTTDAAGTNTVIGLLKTISTTPQYQTTQPVSISTTVSTTEQPPTTIAHAQVPYAGTPLQLASNACKSVTIKAMTTNVGTIYVGGSSVTSSTGFPLGPGDTLSLDISNTNVIWITGTTSDKISWISNV